MFGFRFSLATIAFICTNNKFCESWTTPLTELKTYRSTTCTKMNMSNDSNNLNRRNLLQSSALSILLPLTSIVNAEKALADESSMNVDDFLKTGMVSQPMGVSGQAGKSKPETGVILREGSEVARDSRSGNVAAEILLGSKDDPKAVLTSYSSPWSLASGTVFDVECRDSKTGDGAFLSVSDSTNGKGLADLPSSFFLDNIMKPTGRFSFYGVPTDVKVKKDSIVQDYRFIELSFSSLSQSTMTEIPRKAIIATTVVPGTENAVMLVGSATATRWNKGSGDTVRKTVESFRAVPAPKSEMKIRAKKKKEEV